MSVTTTEPRFTPEEKFLLLASRRAESVPRGSHGILLSEATDPANERAFSVPLPVMDFAERALNSAKERYKNDYPTADMSALHWRVEKKG